MNKYHEIEGIKFEDHTMFVSIDGQIYSADLSKLSSRIRQASKQEIEDYEVSPSGYGIHWNAIDEDLSFDALFNLR